MKITFIGCNETPERYHHRIGESVDLPDDQFWPSPGFRGLLAGIPGVRITETEWEIRPVDMRTQAERWLDEADALLADEPKAGECIGQIQTRLVQAQVLMLKAQSQSIRRGLV